MAAQVPRRGIGSAHGDSGTDVATASRSASDAGYRSSVVPADA